MTKLVKHSRLKLTIVITVYLSLLSFLGFGQGQYVPLNPTPPSPNATAIQRYGNTDVSLYTGATNITIPIFTATDKGISLPINLRYTGSGGIKVEEMASWVGLGWTLNAGGAVSRTIMNRADDDHVANLGFTSIPTLPDINDPEGLQDVWDYYATGLKDGEPDIFYYNANGLSGKFLIKKGGEVFQIPRTENRIIAYIGTPGSYTQYTGQGRITAFKITDIKGINYWFESLEDSNSRPLSNTWMDNGFYASSWYLTKIENDNATSVINLSYSPYIYFRYPEAVNHIYDIFDGFKHGYSKVETNAQRLSSISFSQGSIHFIATEERCDFANNNYLSEILIKDHNNTLVKKYKFDYNYFGPSGTVLLETPCDNSVNVPGPWNVSDGDHELRLRLDAVQEIGANGLIDKPPYSFSYNTEHHLPSRYSYSRDHWGFFNGQVNSSLEPRNAVEFKDPLGPGTAFKAFGDANRNASDDHMKAGVLTQIQYPTGGRTEFEYESHEAENDELNYYDIVSATSESAFSETQDTYTPTFTLSNNLNLDVTIKVTPSWTVTDQCDLELVIKDAISGVEVHNMQYQDEPADITLPTGQYQFKFRVLDLLDPSGGTVCSQGGGIDIFVNLVWENRVYTQNLSIGGLRIKSIKDFAEGNVLANKKTYEYQANGESSGTLITVPIYGFYWIIYPSGIPIVLDWMRTYYSNIPLATTKGSHVGYSKVTEYWGTEIENLGKTEYYYTSAEEYPDIQRGWTHQNGDHQYFYNGKWHYTWIFAKGHSQDWRRGLLKSRIVYKNDQPGYSIVSEEENVYQFLNSEEIDVTSMNPPQAHSLDDDFIIGMTSDLREQLYVKYYKYWTGRFNLISRTSKIYDDNGANPIATTTDYFYENTVHRQMTKSLVHRSDGLSRETRYKYPDDYGSPSLTLDELKDRNRISEIIEQYELVDNKVVGAQGFKYSHDLTSDDVELSESFSLETDNPSPTLPSTPDGDDFSEYVRQHQLTFNNGNLMSFLGPNGIVTSYIYNNQDLPIVKAVGVSANDLLTAYNVAIGGSNYENDIRNHALTADNLVTTYAYIPLVGIESIRDPNGQVTTFIYDDLNRLSEVQDFQGNTLSKTEYHYRTQSQTN